MIVLRSPLGLPRRPFPANGQRFFVDDAVRGSRDMAILSRTPAKFSKFAQTWMEVRAGNWQRNC
jgi:hypothetical protein